MAGSFNIKALVKMLADAVCILIAALPAGWCRLEARFSDRGDLFVLFGQGFSLIPGLPGNWLRRAFGRLTLDGCAADCEIGFLSWFSSRHARIGARVYIGPFSVIGDAEIGEGSLIATRVSILSGKNQHAHGPDGSLIPFSRDRAACVTIGRDTWIGEGAIVMADVGDHCIVASGAVVTSQVAAGQVVGGNPARVIRILSDIPASPDMSGSTGEGHGNFRFRQEEKGKSMA
jgi:virginiamycin A acetyltransferase